MPARTRNKRVRFRAPTIRDRLQRENMPLIRWQCLVVDGRVNRREGHGFWAKYVGVRWPGNGDDGLKISNVNVFSKLGPLHTPEWATHVSWTWR